MITETTQNIVRLIKVLASGHRILIFPILIQDETWDGIRLYRTSYELFQISEIPMEDRDQFAGAEEFESILSQKNMSEDDEEILKGILEQILIDS